MALSMSATLGDAIEAIQLGGAQVSFVIDEEGRLLGTVTDGDVRRGLLNRFSLESSVSSIMTRRFTAVGPDVSDQEVLYIMRKGGFHHIPVLGPNGELVEIIVLEDLLRPPVLLNRVLLMAGGEGRRLLPLTEHQPKPMLGLGNRPMLEIVLELCVSAGLTSFYISVNYLKERVMEHFGDGSRWGISIVYLEENEPLGTAGALSMINDPLEAPLLVVNGDILTRVDFRLLLKYHAEHEARATLCVTPFDTLIPFGVVSSDGNRLSRIEEKPSIRHYINAGVYVLDPEIVSSISSPNHLDMPELLEAERGRGPVLVFPIHEYWSDIGSPETFRQAAVDWS